MTHSRIPFERNPKIDAAVERVADYLTERKRGEYIPWFILEELSGFQRRRRDVPPDQSQHWPTFWRRVTTYLRDRLGMWYTVERGNGITLQMIPETLHNNHVRRLRKARSQHRRNAQELAAIPEADMTDRQRAERVAKLGYAHDQYDGITRTIRCREVFTRPTPTSQPRVKP